MMLMILPEASTRYFSAFGSKGAPVVELTSALIEEIETLRGQIRAEEPGGMCHEVSEILRRRYGWEPLSVAYLSDDGRVICSSHVVCILPGGGVLDGTRDQFGEGHSVSLIPPQDREIGRYRPEFMEDWHPGHADDHNDSLTPWLPIYSGKPDYVVQDEIKQQLGHGWWLNDKSLLYAFYAENDYVISAPGI